MSDIRRTAQRVAERLLSGEKIDLPEAEKMGTKMGKSTDASSGVPMAMKKGEKKGAGAKPVAKSPGQVNYSKESQDTSRSRGMLESITGRK
jgi:hypothetical protein